MKMLTCTCLAGDAGGKLGLDEYLLINQDIKPVKWMMKRDEKIPKTKGQKLLQFILRET